MLLFRCEGPVKVTCLVFHKMRKIRLEQNVESEALAGLLDEWDAKFPDDLTASAVAPEQEAGLDLVGALGHIIPNFTDDHVR
jgi:hypothetical protein